jgi:hypothetical protein
MRRIHFEQEGYPMKCQVCGMDVKDHPKADADGNCMVCGQKMESDRQKGDMREEGKMRKGPSA